MDCGAVSAREFRPEEAQLQGRAAAEVPARPGGPHGPQPAFRLASGSLQDVWYAKADPHSEPQAMSPSSRTLSPTKFLWLL